MKKLLLVLLFFSLSFSVFSQELIGGRLIYSKSYGTISIFDAIDKQEYRIYLKNAAENLYDIIRYNQRIRTIDIYSNEITTFFAQDIKSWGTTYRLHSVWQQYASQIAERMTIDVREMYPNRRPLPPGRERPGTPVPGDIQTITSFQPGAYYVQIGAYANLATANSEIAKVDSSLPRAIMQVTVNIRGMNTNVNRVLIGPLNRSESRNALQRFRTNYVDAFIWER